MRTHHSLGHAAERRVPVLLSLALMLVAPFAAAQQDATFQRGFAAEKVYAFGEIDSVNLFNGNLVLTIPIGGIYPVGGRLSYGLVLTYNSNVWDFQSRIVPLAEYLQARPGGQFNAGLGFMLTLGQLHAPGSQYNQHWAWQYVSEDGSQHAFYDRLHVGESSDTSYAYTRDGSYLRMKVVTATKRTVELPDGTVKSFELAGTQWRLTSIADRFGNELAVTYPTNQWKLSDGHREHYVNFATLTSDGQTAQYVSSIELATVGGGPRAVYTFTYLDRTIQRHCENTDPLLGVNATVATLSTVSLPDGSTWRADDYYGTCAEGTGMLKRLVLPTLGRLEWTYQTYSYPQRSPGVGGGTLQLASNQGVATKKVLNASGTCETWETIGCQWTYTWSGATGPRKTTVRYPTGDETVFWFSQPFGLSTTGYTGWEYGLPIHPTATDGAGRFLSQEIYDGTAASGTKKRSVYLRYERDKVPQAISIPEDWYNTNRRPASEKTVFHDDGGRYAETTWSEFDGLGHYRKAVTSGSFGAGDVRTAYTGYSPESGIYDIVASTNAAAADHSYQVWPVATNWVLDTFDQRWQEEGGVRAVELFCFENQKLPSRNGYLRRHRVLAGAAPASNDLLTDYEPFLSTDPDYGEVKRERHFGGDVQTVPTTTSWCTDALAGEQYRVDHTYAGGTRATSRWVDGAGTNLPFYTLQLDVDPHTGLPVKSWDVSGILTDYTYDAQGRLTWEKPQAGHGAWISYAYTRATSASAMANVLIVSRPNSSLTGSLAQSRVWFDGFGRVWRDQRLGAGGAWSTVDTVWNAMGWKRSVTERQPIWPSKWTLYKDYDPFGRPQTIQPSDGSGHDVKLAYLGTRQTTRQVKVKLATGEAYVSTIERYDRQGRLWQVVEPSGAGGANVTTTYGHDVGNRLKSVSIAGGTTQTRTFNYDLRGLLTWERHPEKGVSGNGYVRYLDYDALGNPRRKLDAVGTASATTGAVADLRFTYDRAGRLTHVRDGLQASRLLKQLTYGTGNSGTDRRLGRLWIADRYNYVSITGTPFKVQVKETYAYAGVGGRTSTRTTQMYVNDGAQESFVQGWAWNDLGSPTTLTYPRCTQAGCTGGAATSRTVTHGYSNGFLTSIPGFATGISYHPNGMVNQVTYQVAAGSPALTWTQGLDPNGMRRPASYTVTSGLTTRWSTGTYTYDGAGNVGSIGTSSFVYDGASRLTSGTVYLEPTTAVTAKTQSAVFDPYGNITSKTTGGGLVNTPTSASTNRITSVGSAYDSAGSMTAWNGNAYTYDPLGMAWQVTASGATYVHLYTADDERIWTFQQGAPSRWTLRDLDGKVLREFKNNAGTWTLERDYVHRDGMPLAAVTATATTYLHPDHLGTPRLITSNTGAVLAYHVYHPFGEEATAFNQDTERMKFTGHERDLGNLASAADDMDYMHARFYNPQTGRFLSVDPADSSRRSQPQSWNRFGYALGNPIRYWDIDGRESSAAIALDNDIEDLLSGKIDQRTYLDRIYARGSGALFGASLFIPGPEEVLLATLGRAFRLAPIARGRAVERVLADTFGGGLHPNFPIIDRFKDGIATSVKSLDLSSKSSQDSARLFNTLKGHVNKLRGFKGAEYGGDRVLGGEIQKRVLEIVIQGGKMSDDQKKAFTQAIMYARANGIQVKIFHAASK